MCTTKQGTGVFKKAFLAFGASSIISHQIVGKYKDLDRPTISIVVRG